MKYVVSSLILYVVSFFAINPLSTNENPVTPAIWMSTGGLGLHGIIGVISYIYMSHKQTKVLRYVVNTSILSLLSHLLYIYGYSVNYTDVFGISIPSSLYLEWIACGVPNTWKTLLFLNVSTMHRWKATLFYCFTILFGFLANRSLHVGYAVFFYASAVLCFVCLMRLIVCIQLPTSPTCTAVPFISLLICVLYGMFPVTYWFCLVTGLPSVDAFFLMSSLAKSCIVVLVYQHEQSALIDGEERRRRDFVKYIFHELRTPLNSIQIAADLLEDSEIGSNLQVSCRYVQETLNNVLYVYSGEEKQWKLDLSSFSLHHFETQLLLTIKPLLLSKQITYETCMDPSCPTIVCTDMNKLLHICVNLWTNAIKYTPEQGHIRMVVSWANDILVISIKDTGCGIAPEFAGQLFKHFSQLPQGYQRLNGSGLGLSICRELSEFMGGTVVLKESAVGKGSTFEVSIPVRSEVYISIPDITKSPFMKKSISVLLIDDHATNLKMLDMLFKKYTDRIRTATNGREGIECVKKYGPFDLIVVDNIMPEMDGQEFCKYVRKELKYDRLVFGLTGNVMPEDIQAFLDAGADLILEKPIKLFQINECLRFIEMKGPFSYPHLCLQFSNEGLLKWGSR